MLFVINKPAVIQLKYCTYLFALLIFLKEHSTLRKPSSVLNFLNFKPKSVLKLIWSVAKTMLLKASNARNRFKTLCYLKPYILIWLVLIKNMYEDNTYPIFIINFRTYLKNKCHCFWNWKWKAIQRNNYWHTCQSRSVVLRSVCPFDEYYIWVSPKAYNVSAAVWNNGNSSAEKMVCSSFQIRFELYNKLSLVSWPPFSNFKNLGAPPDV